MVTVYLPARARLNNPPELMHPIVGMSTALEYPNRRNCYLASYLLAGNDQLLRLNTARHGH